MAQNGPKRPLIGQIWPEKAPNRPKWPKMAVKWPEEASKWAKMALRGPKLGPKGQK